jgi:hypothetical protein
MLKHMFYATTALMLSATSAMAATADGTQGNQSVGTIDVSIEILEEVNILGLVANGAIDFGVWDSSSVADETASVDVCIYRNNGTDYDVTATTSSAGAAFILEGVGTPANTIAFTLTWDVGGSDTALATGVAATESTGDNDPTCTASFPVQFDVVIANAALAAQTNQDVYSTEITLTIDPA